MMAELRRGFDVSTTALRDRQETRVQKANPSLRGMTLRCYVYNKAPDCWIAECIDLDLIVQAKTGELAARGLFNALIGYLKTTSVGDTSGLIPRPSPWSHRLRYRLFCLGAFLNFARRNFRIIDYSPNCLPECIA